LSGPSAIGSEGGYYGQGFSFSPSFFIYRSDVHQLRIRTSLTVQVELTDSDTTTYRNEPQVLDMPLMVSDAITLASWGGANTAPGGPFAAFDPTLAGGGENHTWFLGTAGVYLPTSKYSQAVARYLTTHVQAGLRQRIKLLGSAAPGLQNVTLSLRETWQHDFTRAVTPTSSSLGNPRESSPGDPFLSDQLSGTALIHDRLIHELSLLLPLYGDLQLAGHLQIYNEFPYEFKSDNPCELFVQTGCIDTPDPEGGSSVRTSLQVGGQLAYQIIPEIAVDAGVTVGSAASTFGGGPSVFLHADLTFFPVELLRRTLSPQPPSASRE